MQDIIIKYPCEILEEENLKYIRPEVSTGNRRLDIILEDRMNRKLLIEVQQGSLDTQHIDRHIDFAEGYLDNHPEEDIKVIFIANRIDPLRKRFLDRRGYEYKEIPYNKFANITKKYNIDLPKEDTDKSITIKSSNQITQNSVNKLENQKRESFLRSENT